MTALSQDPSFRLINAAVRNSAKGATGLPFDRGIKHRRYFGIFGITQIYIKGGQ